MNEEKNYPYMVYVRFDENGKVESFQGRKNSGAREGETAFPPDWGGSIGDDINSFADGHKITPQQETETPETSGEPPADAE
jgi:hypothetical protein